MTQLHTVMALHPSRHCGNLFYYFLEITHSSQQFTTTPPPPETPPPSAPNLQFDRWSYCMELFEYTFWTYNPKVKGWSEKYVPHTSPSWPIFPTQRTIATSTRLKNKWDTIRVRACKARQMKSQERSEKIFKIYAKDTQI